MSKWYVKVMPNVPALCKNQCERDWWAKHTCAEITAAIYKHVEHVERIEIVEEDA